MIKIRPFLCEILKNQNSATVSEIPLLFRSKFSSAPKEKNSATFEQSSGKIRYLAAVVTNPLIFDKSWSKAVV